jgi:LysM repeat protein
MSSSHPRRVGALVGPIVVGAFILASCGGADDTVTRSTIDLSADSTAFVVRPPATTTPPADTAAGTVDAVQEYVVQSGDAPIVVANRFNVSVDDLIAINEWGPGEFAFPGQTIKIPPGGTAPGAAPAAATEAGDTAAPAATIPDAGDNCGPGSYTIEATDTTRTKVADKFDVTVGELDAANANTPGYSAFFPGLEIVIPAKSDC